MFLLAFYSVSPSITYSLIVPCFAFMDCISRAVVDIDILSRNSSFGFDSAPFISHFGIL